MNLAILTPAVFPFNAVKRKLWIFIESLKIAMPDRNYQHPVIYYGIGRKFPGYRQLCLDMQLEYLKTMTAYSHVLYTDSWDTFFCGPVDEIISKYEATGSPPILCSAHTQLGNESDMSKYEGCFDDTVLYRYPQRGGYIAEVPAIIEAFERMLQRPELTGDDAHEWYKGWKEGWFRPVLDSECQIFQVTDEYAVVDDTGRLLNTWSAENPCILHLAGGYCDPNTGKDDRLIPWAKRLGVIE